MDCIAPIIAGLGTALSSLPSETKDEKLQKCSVRVLEISHPHSVENLRDDVDFWWL